MEAALAPFRLPPGVTPDYETPIEEIFGLKWRVGDAVLDTVTKERGEILAGTRETVTVQAPEASRPEGVRGETA